MRHKHWSPVQNLYMALQWLTTGSPAEEHLRCTEICRQISLWGRSQKVRDERDTCNSVSSQKNQDESHSLDNVTLHPMGRPTWRPCCCNCYSWGLEILIVIKFCDCRPLPFLSFENEVTLHCVLLAGRWSTCYQLMGVLSGPYPSICWLKLLAS